jgi:hypothetical protein
MRSMIIVAAALSSLAFAGTSEAHGYRRAYCRPVVRVCAPVCAPAPVVVYSPAPVCAPVCAPVRYVAPVCRPAIRYHYHYRTYRRCR